MKRLSCLLYFVFLGAICIAQDTHPAYWEDIQAFKKRDSIDRPPQHAILFVGSSSFTKWTDVQQYFPSHVIINRGFGGSTLPDVIRFADDIIFPYHPRQIVIYCGENDLASSNSVTADTVYQRFIKLFTIIRRKLPATPVIFVSLKPSPSRWQLRNKMIEVNTRIKRYLSRQKNARFIDVYHKMLNESGLPIKAIYLDDSLHMNSKGYAIWQKSLQPYLKK